jgi:hypothetical protein
VSAHAQSLDPLTWSNPPDVSLSGAGAAPPFRLAADATSRERALTCLASAVYYEAAGQPLQGQQAVAQVVLNRVRHVAYPKTVCGVIYEGAPRRGCQFTFACDGSLDRPPGGPGWRTAVAVAEQALDGFVEPSVGASTHYHTVFVHPLWDEEMRMVRRIGAHLFYRAPGVMGDPAALTGVYAGQEPDLADLAVRSPPDPAALQPSRAGRTARAAVMAQTPRPAAFSIWGLQVATVRPMGDSVSVVPDRSGT